MTTPRARPHPTLVIAALALSSCGLFYTDIDEYPCPPEGTTLTYENFGASFMTGYCQSCHGSLSEDRAGAPGESIFDTVGQIQRQRDRIFARSAAGNDSMPPGPEDPSPEDREKLAEWLACGAPP